MDLVVTWIVPALIAVAILYSSVGHGGASGYLAVMALAGLAPETIRPAALSLNLVVSLVATFRFGAAGHLRIGLLLPFLVASVPAAFLGGSLPVEPELYDLLLGVVLLLAGLRLAWEGIRGGEAAADESPGGEGASGRNRGGEGASEASHGDEAAGVTRHAGTTAGPEETGEAAPATAPYPIRAAGPTLPVALAAGLTIGLASGLIGVGGGIFLSPLVLLMGWATARETAALSAPFILLNSAAGLSGQVLTGAVFPPALPVWLAAVLAGGWIGATFGSRRARPRTLRGLLGAVLLMASAKLLLS